MRRFRFSTEKSKGVMGWLKERRKKKKYSLMKIFFKKGTLIEPSAFDDFVILNSIFSDICQLLLQAAIFSVIPGASGFHVKQPTHPRL